MTTCVDEQALVLVRIRSEYLEMPDLRLRPAELARLCGVDRAPCQLALERLVHARFLRIRPDGTYVRVGEGVFARDGGERRKETLT
jgi:DNA-binding GntR family transcriptional regulator